MTTYELTIRPHDLTDSYVVSLKRTRYNGDELLVPLCTLFASEVIRAFADFTDDDYMGEAFDRGCRDVAGTIGARLAAYDFKVDGSRVLRAVRAVMEPGGCGPFPGADFALEALRPVQVDF